MTTRPEPADHATRGLALTALAMRWGSGYHTFWYRMTGGLIGHRVGGIHVLLLDHIGSRSGRRYTSPLLYGQDGRDLIVVASKGGAPQDPAWYRNLMAHPDVTVQVGRRRLEVRARAASAEEKPRLWAIMLRQWPGYDGYQRHAGRVIPVVILEPRSPSRRAATAP